MTLFSFSCPILHGLSGKVHRDMFATSSSSSN
uniref:Uncharacterized protein n=1 Tax=Anguilla anguilla TaxID=7936 RepID=A0A0E9VJ16_ANGAN